MTLVLAGTRNGFHALGTEVGGRPPGRVMNAAVRHDGAWWAISDHDTVWRDSGEGAGEPVARLDAEPANCLLPIGDAMLIGAGAASLYRLEGGELTRVTGFDEAPGRAGWYTPWGGPPDVRSMAADRSGRIYANVHVGGVLRSDDAGATWAGTMDIDADVHQVIADPDRAGRAYAAAAAGLGATDGESWAFETDGLVGGYCRAVAVSAHYVFVSSSRGPGGQRAAVYRRRRMGGGALERCRGGLPEWFSANVDTFCLVAADRLVIAGDPNGTVYRSEDEGETWEVAATDLPGVTCLAIG